MSASPSSKKLEDDVEIDAIATEFEKALRRGEEPAIEELCRLNAGIASDLRWELIVTELEYRAASGVPLDWTAYEVRFPDDVEGIRAIRRAAEARRSVGAADTTRAHGDDSVAAPAGRQLTALGEAIDAPLRVDDYQLVSKLGQGGQGEVWLARQKSLDRPVAIKLLHKSAGYSEAGVQRFLREARTLAQSRHPHIVTIHGIGRLDDGGYFLVMEYVDGDDLAKQLKQRSFEPREAVEIISKVANAIDHAHQRGVIHRDLKPSNVLWDELRGPVVTDFGLAKELRRPDDLTLPEQMLGTPTYMAPEQAHRRFGAISERTDVYGLSATLFALLTGSAPYAGDSLAEVLEALTSADPPPEPLALNPKVPAELSQICCRGLTKDQAARIVSVKAFADELSRWLRGDPPLQSSDSPPQPTHEAQPNVFGRYRLLESLTADATRRVHRAVGADGTVALLKYLPAEWLGDRIKRSQFRQEVLLSTRLQHPCLAKVLEVGSVDCAEFIALELVEGESLASAMHQTGAFSQELAAEILAPIAEALQLIHQAGVIYRDLRPQNVLLTASGAPMLAEVRFSEELAPNDNATLAGSGPVTSQYIAPELILGNSSTVLSDVYSLGATLYAMVTGHAPFDDAKDTLTVMVHKSQGQFLDPRTFAAQLSEEVVALISAALSPTPKDRPSSAAEFAERLRRAIARSSTSDCSPNEVPAPDHELIYDDNVQFSIYRPKAVAPATWARMLVFAHTTDLPADAPPDAPHPLEEVRRQAEQALGTLSPSFLSATSDSSQAVPREGELTLVPSGDGLEFNPPSRTFRWLEPAHREEFRFRAAARLAGQAVKGRLSVFLGSILIAEVTIATRVNSGAGPAVSNDLSIENRAFRFRRIYACVAPEDAAVADQFRHYAEAVQDRFLQSQLVNPARLFDQADRDRIKSSDVFQLYWSANALESKAVTAQWRYAMSLNRPAFVRPLYWQEPLPRNATLPPPELMAIGFTKIPAATVPAKTPRDAPEPAGNRGPDAAYLEILSGQMQGRILRLVRDRVTIGRHPECDLALHSLGASRFHTQLIREHGRWFVEDLQTRNGTYLNGVRVVGRTVLNEGDKLHVADVILVFRDVPATSAQRWSRAAPGVRSHETPEGIDLGLTGNDRLLPKRASGSPEDSGEFEFTLDNSPDGEEAVKTDHEAGYEDTLVEHPVETHNEDSALSQISGYRMLGVVAQGGFGRLYRVQDPDGKIFLLRKINKSQLRETDWGVRKERQALLHPAITRLFKVGETTDSRYGVFEYVDGQPLQRRVDGGPLSSRDAAEIMRQVAAAIHAAHLQGWGHGHLSPSEVLLTEKAQPKLWHFQPCDGTALARQAVAGDAGETAAAMCGVPAYMAPEQVQGTAWCSVAADVYALGATLYFLVTAKRPFIAETIVELLKKTVQESPVPPQELNPNVDPGLQQLILKCLQKRPQDRYANASAVAEALRQIVGRLDAERRPLANIWRRMIELFPR